MVQKLNEEIRVGTDVGLDEKTNLEILQQFHHLFDVQ